MTDVYPKYILTDSFDLQVGDQLYHGNGKEWYVCTIAAIYEWSKVEFVDIIVIKSGSDKATVGTKASYTTRVIKNNYLKILPFNSPRIWHEINI